MDEAYASPDSDGHASLPSPTDSTFDLSLLPTKRRGRQQDPIIVSSSFINAPTENDSSDDDEDDETFLRNTLAGGNMRMLPTSPGLLSSAVSSAAKPRSKVLVPKSAKNDDNTPRNTPRHTPRGPRPAIHGNESSRENIDPKGSSRKHSPPRLVLHKPEDGSNDEGENPIVNKTVPLASTILEEASCTGAVVNESLIKAPGTRFADGSTTPFGDAYERSLDSLTLRQAPSTPVKKSPAPSPSTPEPLASIPKLRKPRKSVSPQKTTPQPPAPPSPPKSVSPKPIPTGNKLNLTPETPHLRYLNWLNSDSIDEGLSESPDIPAGHSARLRKAQAQRIIDETAFLGGDEASFMEKEEEEGNESMKEEILNTFHRSSGSIERAEESFFDEDVDLNESRLTAMSEEHILAVPLRRMLNGDESVPKDSEGVVKRLGGIVTYDGAGDDKSERSVSPVGSLESGIQQPAPESQDFNEKQKDKKEVTANNPESSSQYPSPESIAAKPSSPNSTPALSDIVTMIEDGSSAPPDETRIPVNREKDPRFSVEDPTMPQFFSNTSKSPNKTTGFKSPTASTSIQSSSSDKTIRPSIAQVQKVEKPVSSTLAGVNPQNPFPDGFLAQSTPREDYNPYNLRELKNSNRARRVSMNTPPSSLERSLSGNELLNPPDFSSLGSGFSFASIPVRYKEWDPDSVAREFTPPFPVEGSRAQGYNPPQNTPTPAAGKKRALVGLGGIFEEKGRKGKGRARSKSDPLENKAWEVGKGLFTPGRLKGEGEGKSGDATDKNVLSEDIVENVKGAEGQDKERVLEDDLELELSESENERGERHWSGFTQEFRGRFAVDKEASRKAGQPENSIDPSTLNLGNVEFRVHTPASIGESKDVTNDLIDGSNKTLWLRMAQAEAENDRFRRLLESNNIKIGDSSQDLSGVNLNVNFQDSRDMSTRSSDFNISTSEDLGSLRRRVMELEGLLEIFGRKQAELRAENERKDNLVMHWRNQYNDVQKLAVQNQKHAMGLENHVKNLEQQAAVNSVNHDREINKVVSILHTEKQDVIKHSRQKSIGLEDRLKFFEQRVHDTQEDVEEKDRTIAHLRQALSRRESIGAIGNGDETIAEIQEKLYEQLQAHEADTAKFTNLLEEKEGLVRHLQAELDEMVNLMPVDHGSSRMIDEEEAEDWLDEKSREISQYYDDGLDQIITELHGTGEREDFEEAVEEAEMSLRRVAEEAGLDEPLDKATLAAFGIRQLRTEYTMIKRLLIESEGRAKELMQANDEFARRGDQTEKLRVSEEQRIAFQTVAKEAEAAGKMLADQVDALRAKLIDAEQHIRHLEAENETLEIKLTDADERATGFEADKEALQRLVNDTKRLNDMLKSQSAETEQRNQGFEEEIVGLRRQLAEEKGHVSVVETETITLRQQITEWEETTMAIGKEKEGVQTQLKDTQDRLKVLVKEKDALKRQLDEATKVQVASKEIDTLKKTTKELQERLRLLTEQHSISTATVTQLEGKLKHGDQAAQRLVAEKEFLKAELEIAASETKAARGRFAQLLHDTAEKEAKWMNVRSEFSLQGSMNTGEASSGAVAAYKKSLSTIISEIEKDTLPVSYSNDIEEDEKFEIEGVQDPELVKVIIQAFRLRDRIIADTDEKSKRYRGVVKKCMKDNEKKKARVDELVAEVKELRLRLKAEKKSNDEKMGQMILALRRGE